MLCAQAGRFSGSGARYCTRCADGTWSRPGSTFCLSANVGLVAPTGGHYSFVLDSALVFSGRVGLDQDNITEQIGEAIYASATEYVGEFLSVTTVHVYDVRPSGTSRRLVDSTTWFSNKDVQKNCSWVGAAADLVVQRCRVKGVNNERALSACPGICAGDAGRRLQDFNESTTVRFYVNATYDSSPAENASEIISLARLELIDGLELWLLDGAAQKELNGSLNADVPESLRAIQSTSISHVHANTGDATTNTTVCPPGKFSLAGQWACEDCPVGFWNPLEKQATCKFAEAGHFVNVTGSSQQHPCAPGTISPGSAASECTCISVSVFTCCSSVARPARIIQITGPARQEGILMTKEFRVFGQTAGILSVMLAQANNRSAV